MAKMTNGEFYENKTEEELMEISQEERCEPCTREVPKHMDPGAVCEGAWCELGLEAWLEEEYNDLE